MFLVNRVTRHEACRVVTAVMMRWLNSPAPTRSDLGDEVISAVESAGFVVMSTDEFDAEIEMAHRAGVCDGIAEEGL